MKQKFFLALLTFGLLFVIFSIKANSASAATLGAEFSNRDGPIGLTVYYRFWNGGAPVTQSYEEAYVAAGSAQSRFKIVASANGPSVQWYTDCADPNTNLAQWADGVWGVSLKIHAENPCGEPQITTISCPAPGNILTFSWQMTGRAAGLPYNVDKYHLFRSAFPDTSPNESNNYIGEVPSTQTSVSWSGMTSGQTYYVRVSAAPPSVPPNDAPNDAGWSSPAYGQVTCGSATAPPQPTDLFRTVPSCSDSLYQGNFSWNISGTVTKTEFRLNGSTFGYWP